MWFTHAMGYSFTHKKEQSTEAVLLRADVLSGLPWVGLWNLACFSVKAHVGALRGRSAIAERSESPEGLKSISNQVSQNGRMGYCPQRRRCMFRCGHMV